MVQATDLSELTVGDASSEVVVKRLRWVGRGGEGDGGNGYVPP